MMGIIWSNNFHPVSLDNVRSNVVHYLLNDNYSANPDSLFSKAIRSHGYTSLEHFISDIPEVDVKKYCSQPIILALQNTDLVQKGARFILNGNPSVVGSSTMEIYLSSHHEVVLQLDETSTTWWRTRKVGVFFIACRIWRWLTRFFGLHAWFRRRRNASKFKIFQVSNLQLEKNYYLQFLKCSGLQHNDVKNLTGQFKGIHGANNSCYMDSLFFTMFYTTSIFDEMLEGKSHDTKYARRLRRLLAKYLVRPLRSEAKYVLSEEVMKLREHLSQRNSEVMGSFMDVEELLYLVLQDILKEENFIKYFEEVAVEEDVEEEEWGDFMHLMVIDEADTCKFITVQDNVETSFKLNDMKMKAVPYPSFILGMPRSDRKLVNYEAVVPTVKLCIGKLMQKANCKCGTEAEWDLRLGNEGLVGVLCETCRITGNFLLQVDSKPENCFVLSRNQMKLLGIICIRGAHFTTFVRSVHGGNDVWLYFDSMAGGYPEVTLVPQLGEWLEKLSQDLNAINTENILPVHVERAIKDGHICFYEPLRIPFMQNKN